MKLAITLMALSFFCMGMDPVNPVREKNLTYTRVREAYHAKEKVIARTLASQGISRDSLRIYLRAFKTEKVIELWAKNVCDSAYVPIKEFTICDLSGNIGPKRRSRDLQVPEGFYYLSDMNPYSKYYLSLKINYPNASDSVRGVRGHLGNLIYIHGSCISSGCLAMTDDRIKELFVYCVEAYNSGQEKIGITIYPSRLEDAAYSGMISRYGKDKDKISLWGDLKKSYDQFNLKKNPPEVRFLPDGTHEVK